MMKKPLVSLCIPTNGVIEWVIPVLNSIYESDVDEELYEVIVADDGDSLDFKESMRTYAKDHSNLHYHETTDKLFMNEIASYKLANGDFIKFINHRTKLANGFLKRLISFVEDNLDTKPIVYFSNGQLKSKNNIIEVDSFDLFVRNLSFWSSWSTGMAMWKSDVDCLLKEKDHIFNELFPHTDILFLQRTRNRYLIDNTISFNEIPQGNKPKGKYDVFYAFGFEYPRILLDLYRQDSITKKTYKTVLKNNLSFLSHLYWLFCIRKNYCSYELHGLKKITGLFYSRSDLFFATIKTALLAFWKRITRL